MIDDILFISVFTKGYRDLAVNHLISLRKVGILNTLSFCNDSKTVEILNYRGFKTKEFPFEMNEDLFDPPSENFNKFSFVKYILIDTLLKDYKYVWYLDVDTVIIKDIRNLVDLTKNVDIYIQNDINVLLSGGMLVSNNEKCKNLMKILWDKQNDKYCDQLILNGVLQNEKLNIKGEILSMGHFRPGIFFFNNNSLLNLSPKVLKIRNIFLNDKTIDIIPALIHANFIVGINNKINALKSKRLWFN